MTEQDPGAKAQAWLHRLAQCSEPGPGVTRLPFTPEHRAAVELLTGWMTEAGLSVRMDAAGTLIGRLEGPAGAPTLLLGSHQDSVREGGAYDGIMGVVLPILALMELRDRGERLPYAVEVLAFADEEGVRFPTALMGPRALAGTFDMAALDLRDGDGIPLREAMIGFGLDPDALPALRRDPAQTLGWIECHLEQGPVLESRQRSLGVVTAICGIERHAVTLTGRAAHAGTVPMELRRDALAAAAELVLAVERCAREREPVLATVGQLEVRPGAVNAIPGSVQLTVEVRSALDAERERAAADLMAEARAIAERRGCGIEMARTYAQAATTCAAGMTRRLGDALVAAVGSSSLLPSGATHDASAMADLCPVGMIFTTCREGVSHHPDEYVPPAAMADVIEALVATLVALKDSERAAA